MAQKRKSTAPRNTRKSSSRKGRPPKIKVIPYLVAAAFSMLCLCITMADYVNPFSLFPTWDQIFTTVERIGGQDISSDASGVPGTHSTVTVHMIDVGQADSILIEAPQANVLIDGGENGSGDDIIAYLKNQSISTLDIVIGTHAHSDHIGGLDEVIEEMKVEKVILPEMAESSIPTTKTYTNLLTAILEKGLSITTAQVGDTYSLGDGAKLQIVGPNGIFTDLNNTSVVCKLTYGETSFLFTGDCEDQAEAAILNRRGIDLSADVLKVGHHGSDTSTSDAFLEAVDPEIALISCGVDNSYGHPSPATLEKLTQWGAEIYRTDLDGSIVVTSDGMNLKVKTEKS